MGVFCKFPATKNAEALADVTGAAMDCAGLFSEIISWGKTPLRRIARRAFLATSMQDDLKIQASIQSTDLPVGKEGIGVLYGMAYDIYFGDLLLKGALSKPRYFEGRRYAVGYCPKFLDTIVHSLVSA